ncbi:MAG TPA: hypothetical protein DEP87_02855 [Candidatus Pacebacteria bacterium]|nr:hypothetical protein [Candidatus Paceibacterota bacterium]
MEKIRPEYRRKPKFTRENTRGVERYHTIGEIIDKVKKDGIDPTDFIRSATANKIRTIGFGEHHFFSGCRTSEIEIITRLSDEAPRPLRHLALEFQYKHQSAIDEFMVSGDLSALIKAFPKLWQKNDWVEIVNLAQRKKIKIHCVDGNWKAILQALNPFEMKASRDKKIHEKIFQISKKNPDELTLAILGSHHISNLNDASFHPILDLSYPKLNDLLPNTYLPIVYKRLSEKDLKGAESLVPKSGLLVPTGDDNRFDATYFDDFDDYCGNYGGVIFVSEQITNFNVS